MYGPERYLNTCTQDIYKLGPWGLPAFAIYILLSQPYFLYTRYPIVSRALDGDLAAALGRVRAQAKVSFKQQLISNPNQLA